MKFFPSVLAFLVLAGAAAAQEKAPSADKAAIQKVLDAQVAAWNKGDLLGFMEGYWNSKDLTFYSGKEKHLGWDQALARYQKRYQGEGKEMGKLSFAELEVQVLNPDFAVVKGRWTVEMKKETVGGLFTLVMKKIDGKWLIVHDHTSS